MYSHMMSAGEVVLIIGYLLRSFLKLSNIQAIAKPWKLGMKLNYHNLFPC